jgi:hypothetical protein
VAGLHFSRAPSHVRACVGWRGAAAQFPVDLRGAWP